MLERVDKVATDADFLNAPVPPGRDLPGLDMSGPDRFINRELSWLGFNWRVMAEAENPVVPLLERVRFLAISGANLDEFYTVRVAGLRGLVRAGFSGSSSDGLTPVEQLRRIEADARALMARQQEAWKNLLRLMKSDGIEVLAPAALRGADLKLLEPFFFGQVFPILTPLAVDPAHPFPFIASGGFAMGLQLRRDADGAALEALLPVPAQIPRFVALPGGSKGQSACCRWRGCWRSSSIGCFPAMSCSGSVPSASCATATSRSRRRPRT